MKERPILFNGAMVRALLAGTKTQTRRVVKPQPTGFVGGPGVTLCDRSPAPLVPMNDFAGTCGQEIICPYGQPGDRLWVRETWHDASSALHSCALYRADGGEIYGGKWAPSIHMPRWASRITLEITGVRVERLQHISEADAKAEGIEAQADGIGWKRGPISGDHPNTATRTAFPKIAYQSLWESINGPSSWEANPWVWVLEFRRLNVEHSQC